MRLSPRCKSLVRRTGSRTEAGTGSLSRILSTRRLYLAKKNPKKWQSCNNQCDESSGEDRRGCREKDSGASNCERVSAHKQQTSVYPDNRMQDEAMKCRTGTQEVSGKHSHREIL